MKRVRVNKGYVGIVYRNEDYKRVLTAGVYWIGLSETVRMHDMAEEFKPEVELSLLLQDKALKEMLTVVTVADNEIALHFVDGNFTAVLTAGRYAFWKGLKEHSFITDTLESMEISPAISVALLQKIALQSYVRVYTVESFEKALLYFNGVYQRELTSGTYYFWRNSTSVTVERVDLRQQRVEISGQEILTKDKAALRVNLEALYKVVDITRALVLNRDYAKQLYVSLQMALREYIGTQTLDELLENKEVMNLAMLKATREKAEALGVQIADCGIKDIILPGEVKDIMNQVLVAQKRAQANVITRREETASTRSLLNTAKLLEENPMLVKLKEMEYVEKIAERINTISLSGNNQIGEQLRDIFVKQ